METGDITLRTSSIEAIRNQGVTAVDPLLRMASQTNQDVKIRDIATALAAIGPNVDDELLQLVNPPYSNEKRAAILALGFNRENRAVTPLLDALTAEVTPAQIQIDITESLGNIGEGAAGPVAAALDADQSPRHNDLIKDVLVRIGNPAVQPTATHVFEYCVSRQKDYFGFGIHILLKIGTPAAIDAIRSAARSCSYVGEELAFIRRSEPAAAAILKHTQAASPIVAVKNGSVSEEDDQESGATTDSKERHSRQTTTSSQSSSKAVELLGEANSLFQSGLYQLALNKCDEALAQDPTNDNAKALRTRVARTIEVLGNH